MATRGKPLTVHFLPHHIKVAAKKEAKLPTKKSKGNAAPDVRLNSKHPAAKPGMATGVNSANTHSASDARNWIAQVAEPGSKIFCRWVS